MDSWKSKFQIRSLVRQLDQSDCGPACLASVIKYYGGHANLEQLRKICGNSRSGTTMLGLVQGAEQIGLVVDAFEADGTNNLSELNNDLAILHVVNQQGQNHFVVYYPTLTDGELSEQLLIGDPAKGVISMSQNELTLIWKTKALLKLVPGENFVRKKTIDKLKSAWIYDLIKDDTSIIGISVILGIIITFLGFSTALFSQKLIDDFLPNKSTNKLLLGIPLLFLVLICRALLSFIRSQIIFTQSRDFNNRIISKFYNSILHLPKFFFDSRKIGELVARMNDTRRIQSVLSVVVGSVFIDGLTITSSIIFAAFYSGWLATGILVSLPIYFIILLFFNKPILAKQRELMASYSLTESNYIDSIHGISDIKINNKQDLFARINSLIYNTFQSTNYSLNRLVNKLSIISEITGSLSIVIIISSLSWAVLHNHMSLGEMVALIAVVGSIFPTLNRLVTSIVQLQEASIAFDRMFEFVSIDKEPMDGRNTSRFDKVSVRNVSFRFPGTKRILNDVSLELKKGEFIAIVGESGCGKSTLLQLFLKFYTAENGSILVDDVNIQSLMTSDWRNIVGYVPQEVKIFNGPLLFNLALSDKEMDMKEAIDFCERTGFGTFFKKFPQSYYTVLGEEGINLSGGQKQLVGIARVMLRNPQLLLLDESTSALDYLTENFIMGALNEIKNKTAILLVTHRLNTAIRCDKVFEMREGQLSMILIESPPQITLPKSV